MYPSVDSKKDVEIEKWKKKVKIYRKKVKGRKKRWWDVSELSSVHHSKAQTAMRPNLWVLDISRWMLFPTTSEPKLSSPTSSASWRAANHYSMAPSPCVCILCSWEPWKHREMRVIKWRGYHVRGTAATDMDGIGLSSWLPAFAARVI